MSVFHKNLAASRWQQLAFAEQMANIGSEIERAINWKNKGSEKDFRLAFERALELLDLTIKISSGSRLGELLRVREALADYFWFDNDYKSTDALWQNYFFAFTWLVRGKS